MFRTVLCPSSVVFYCTHSSGICHTGLVTANLYGICHCCVYSKGLLVMDRETVRNMQSFIQKKREKLVHLVGFIIRICHDARSPERQTLTKRNIIYMCANKQYMQSDTAQNTRKGRQTVARLLFHATNATELKEHRIMRAAC